MIIKQQKSLRFTCFISYVALCDVIGPKAALLKMVKKIYFNKIQKYIISSKYDSNVFKHNTAQTLCGIFV